MDTYMVFGVDAEWETAAPEPAEWMHQPGKDLGRNHPRWLDADRFREAVESLTE